MNEKGLKLVSITLTCLIGGAELENYALPPHAGMGHEGGDTVPKEIALTMVSTSSSTGSITARGAAPQDEWGHLTKFNQNQFRSIF